MESTSILSLFYQLIYEYNRFIMRARCALMFSIEVSRSLRLNTIGGCVCHVAISWRPDRSADSTFQVSAIDVNRSDTCQFILTFRIDSDKCPNYNGKRETMFNVLLTYNTLILISVRWWHVSCQFVKLCCELKWVLVMSCATDYNDVSSCSDITTCNWQPDTRCQVLHWHHHV